MLCLLSFQDWLSIDEGVRNPDANGERINIPSNPRHYWRWRMHLTIKELRRHEEFCTHVRDIIEHSGR
jgi:4-alpha-glucanotransferase